MIKVPGVGHLLILTRIKVHYIQNAFPEKHKWDSTYGFIVNALSHFDTLFGNNFRKENTFIELYRFLILSFILIGSASQFGSVPYHLKQKMYYII